MGGGGEGIEINTSRRRRWYVRTYDTTRNFVSRAEKRAHDVANYDVSPNFQLSATRFKDTVQLIKPNLI